MTHTFLIVGGEEQQKGAGIPGWGGGLNP